MCNHYTEEQQAAKFAAEHAGIENPPEMPERADVYPKRKAHIIIQTAEGRKFEQLRWGVWPYYARDKPQYLTNARDDGLLIKSAWKQSVAKRRCLIPVGAYYEPGLGPVNAKGEVRFTLRDRSWFFIAGLWDRDPDASGNRAFTMVTTAPNDYAARFHDRMPLVMENDNAMRWLGHEPLPPEQFAALVRTFRADLMQHVEIAPAPKPAPPTKKLKKADLQTQTGELDLGLF